MKYKEALKLFENCDWNEVQNAIFYYRWFGEDWLFDMFKDARDSNNITKKQFISLVEQVNKIRTEEI